MQPLEKFKKCLETSTLYNPVFNFIPLTASLPWFEKKYFECYKTQPQDPVFSLSNKDLSVWYITFEQLKNISLEFGVNFFVDKEKNKKCLEQYEKNLKIVDELYAQIAPNVFSMKGEAKALELLNKIIDAENFTNAAGWFSIYFERELIEEVLEKSNTHIAPEKLEELITKSADPLNGSFEVRSEIKILKLLLQDISLDKLAIEMQYKYAGFNGCESLQKVKENLEDSFGNYINDKELAKTQLKKLEKSLEEKANEFSHWQDTLLTDEKEFSKYVQFVSTMKDALRDYIGKSVTAIYRVGLPILKISNIEEKYFRFILYPELIQGSEFIKTIKESLESREAGFAFISYPNNTSESQVGDIFPTKKELEEIFLRQHGLDTTAEQVTLKGQPASKGFVNGKVRKIIDLEKEGKNMQKGEILVTGMTRPEFVPLMKIAAAIVTDEGGITCHAAIVSRELGIPCVIGTKIATQVLNDGDMVEVDASKGVVKILNFNSLRKDK